MATLFQRNKSTISRHIRDAFECGELNPDSTVAFFATVQKEGERNVSRDIQYYNLDMIISVGYRVLICRYNVRIGRTITVRIGLYGIAGRDSYVGNAARVITKLPAINGDRAF